MDKNSTLYWYPKVENLPVPQPRTETYVIPEQVLRRLKEENMENLDLDAVNDVAEKIDYPVFCRTDQASEKHFWDMASYIPKRKNLKRHLFEIIAHNLEADMLGLDFKALVFREYIPMDSKFTAFYGHMPINPERRYFVDEGEVICHHPYWGGDAIEEPSVENWESLLEEMSTESEQEVELLTSYARTIGEQFIGDGAWSVDFCKAKDGRWIFIDMALAEESFHPECKLNRWNQDEMSRLVSQEEPSFDFLDETEVM